MARKKKSTVATFLLSCKVATVSLSISFKLSTEYEGEAAVSV